MNKQQLQDGVQRTKKYVWTCRFTFSQANATTTIRDCFALLLVKLQRTDSGVQLLPYDPTSDENAINVPKNIPYDDTLNSFLRLPDKQNSQARFMPVYARLTSTQHPGTIKRTIIPYLKQQRIYMQKNDVPSTNLVISGWVYQQHPDYVNGANLRRRMIEQLNGIDEFQLNVRNSFRPAQSLPATTRTWIIEMDADYHEQHFGTFLETFHSENDIVIVPCQGFNTWDSDLSSTKQFV